jgi:hypothetical protein
MIDTKKIAAPPPATSPLIVDLTGRMKKPMRSSQVRRRTKFAPHASTRIYAFPAHQVNPSRHEISSPARESTSTSRRLTLWLRSLTAWHGLVAGAIACYVLIICNLIYGLSSMAQLKVWRPLDGAAVSELQRRTTTPAECERSQQAAASEVTGVPLASVLCSADKSFADALDELFPPGAPVRQPRIVRAH